MYTYGCEGTSCRERADEAEALQWSWRWRGQANEALLKVRLAAYLSPA